MTRKPMKGKAQSLEQSGSIDPELLKLMDEIPVSVPMGLFQQTTERILREDRFVRRVIKWAKDKTNEEVAQELAIAILKRRVFDKLAMHDCEERVRELASEKLMRRRGGRAGEHRHKQAVRTEWQQWQRQPALYAGSKAFRTAMELKFPGLSSLGNWMTEWRKEARLDDHDASSVNNSQ